MKDNDKIIKTLELSIGVLSILSIFNFIGIFTKSSYSLLSKSIMSKNSINIKPKKVVTDVYYNRGVKYHELYTEHDYPDKGTVTFDSDHINIDSPSGYAILYTDVIDLSKYNSVILEKANFDSKTGGCLVNWSRNFFAQYPYKVNNVGSNIPPTWINIKNNLYVADISNYNDKDKHFVIDSCGTSNNGNIYYLAFSNLTVDEIKSGNDDDLVYFNRGILYGPVYTEHDWGTKGKVDFISDYINVDSSINPAFSILYTDSIDLSRYNTVIVKKTNFYSKVIYDTPSEYSSAENWSRGWSRNSFCQYPGKTTAGGESLASPWQNISNNIWAMDISKYADTDKHFFLSAFNTENDGDIYYIALSTKTIEDLKKKFSQ